MDPFKIAGIVLGISALASVFNARVLRLPESIGLMATGLLASIGFMIIGKIFPETILPNVIKLRIKSRKSEESS